MFPGSSCLLYDKAFVLSKSYSQMGKATIEQNYPDTIVCAVISR